MDLVDAKTAWGRQGDTSLLQEHLSRSNPDFVLAFFETLSQKAHKLDTRRHYRSFAFMHDLSDSFLYARLAVIGSGQERYVKVLNSPSSFPGRWRFEGLEDLLYVADMAYESLTGLPFEREARVSIESFSNGPGWA